MASIVGGTRGLDQSLDRISKGIYQNAVRRNRQEHEHVARWAGVLQFREKLAELREGIKASQAYLKDLIPPVVRPMTEPSISHERFANPSANATRSCNFSIGWSGESVRA
jgi:hypothetical protein